MSSFAPSGDPKTYTATTSSGSTAVDLPAWTGAPDMLCVNYGVSDVYFVMGDASLTASVATTGADRAKCIPARMALMLRMPFGWTKAAIAVASGGTSSDVQFQRGDEQA